MGSLSSAKRRLVTAFSVVVLGTLAYAGFAVADNLVADGDGLTPVGDNNISLGSIDCGVESSKTALIAVKRNGNAGSTNVFKNASTVTVSVQSVTQPSAQPDVLRASMAATDISIPSNWGTESNNTLSNTVASQVKVTPSAAGPASGTITYRATGTNSSNNTITMTDAMQVSWNAGSCTPPDATPPAINHTLDPASPDGSNGWYRSDVKLTWDVSDPESALTKDGCVDQNITADQQATTYSCSASSAGGSSGPVNVEIKRDATAPTIERRTADDSCATSGDNGWCRGTQTVGFQASDATSGLAPGTSPFTKTISTDGASQTVGSGPISDLAGNTNAGIQSEGFKIDATPPVVNVTGVADGATYTAGNVPNAGCSTTDATSDVADEASLSTSGGPVGSVTAMCSGGKDNAGNTNSASVTYTVVYDFTGFFRPVDNLPTVNSVKAGSAVPVKFSLDGDQGLNIMAPDYPKSALVACGVAANEDQLENTVTAGGSSLSYDASTGQYTYVWKTEKGWANSCRQLVVKLADGSFHRANFKFTK